MLWSSFDIKTVPTYILPTPSTMPDLTLVRSSNAAFRPTHVPVAIFVGGTSGVGEATLKALASYTGGNVHLFIIGRNKAAAQKTFASIPQPSSDILREFLYCDALLMKNVASACDEIRQKINKINYLVLSAGWIKFTSRDETEEGLDKMLAIRFYERFKFIRELLPLLQHAVDEGEQASVLSILGSKSSPPLSLDDLEMKKSYRSFKAAAYSGAYGDIMVEVSGFTRGGDFTHSRTPGIRKAQSRNCLYPHLPRLRQHSPNQPAL